MDLLKIIEMEDITKNYPMGEITVHALRGLNLTVCRGEFVVLLGPSGSGKTTTLNLAGGLDRPSSGRLTVDGEDIIAMNKACLTEYRRKKIGFVFQFFNLIPTLTALENLEFALALTQHGRSVRAQAREYLAKVGLQDRAGHFPSQLSGGEQQRVAIARALVNRPPILLCDEPTGNLDVETGRQVLQVLHDLNRDEKATVVLVTHNSSIALMANRVIRLHNGAVDHEEINAEPQSVATLTW